MRGVLLECLPNTILRCWTNRLWTRAGVQNWKGLDTNFLSYRCRCMKGELSTTVTCKINVHAGDFCISRGSTVASNDSRSELYSVLVEWGDHAVVYSNAI